LDIKLINNYKIIAVRLARSYKSKHNNNTSKDVKIIGWIMQMINFEQSFIDDVKTLFKILILFSPLPMFWALFEQQVYRMHILIFKNYY